MTRSHAARWTFAALLLGLALDPGCVGTETGNPPAAPDPMLVAEREDPSVEPDSILLAGAPGAVLPADGEVVVLSLDVSRDPSRAPVRDDGSFGPLSSTAPADGVLRLWVERGETRSALVDLRRASDGSLPAYLPPLRDCLDVSSGPEFVMSQASATLEVHNRCAGPVELGAAALRLGSEGVGVSGGAQTLGTGDVAELQLMAEPGAEDVIRLPVLSPETGNRWITVRRPVP